MAISPSVKSFGIAAAVIGIIQGVVWLILGLFVILIHQDAWKPQLDSSTYGQHLSLAITSLYLKGPVDENLYITPLPFFACAIVYLIGSVFWISLSSSLIWTVMQQKTESLKKIYLGWANWTLVLSVYDLILTSFLAVDYDTIATKANLNPSIDGYMNILACGVVMTLAARGFALWVVNVTIAIVIIKLSLDIPKKISAHDLNSNVIDAFSPTTSALSQRGWEPDKPHLTRSNSFVSTSFGTFHGLPRLPPVQSTNERLAHLTRHSSVSPVNPLYSAPPPSTPSYLYSASSPIYIEPKSPVPPPLKSALKNRSQASYG